MSFIDVLTAFSILFSGFTLYFQSTLKNKDDTVSLIDTIIKLNWFEFYRSRLRYSLDTLDNYLGKPSFSLLSIAKNLSFHYAVAIGYVFLVFFIIWFLGGDNSIGAVEILPKKESYLERFIVIVTLVFVGITFYFLSSKKFEAIDEKFKEKFQSFLPQALQEHFQLIQKILIGFISFGFFYNFGTLTYTLISSLLFSLFFDSLLSLIGVVVVGVGVVGLVGLVGLVGVGVVGLGVEGVGVEGVGVEGVGVVGVGVEGVGVGVVGVVGGLTIIFGIISLIDTGTFWNSINISLLIFFLIIPFLNGILDFISLTISRYFSRKILNENLFLVIFHLILDFIFAVVFLFALIGLLYYSIELFNSFVDVKLQIPIGEMLHATKADPFSLENAWITFMLLSTLVPTLLHIILALASILLYVTKTSDWFINEIENSQKSESKRIKASAVLAFPVTLLSIVLFYIFIYLPINFMLGLF